MLITIVFLMLGCSHPDNSPTSLPTVAVITETTAPTEITPIETITAEVPQEKSSWKIAYYVDDFGDPTDDFYLQGTFTGTFSNTATNGSDLTVVVCYDYNVSNREYIDGKAYDTTGGYNMIFRLLEYNDHKATFHNNDNMILKVKIADEITEYELGGIAPNGDLMLTTQFDKSGNFPPAMIFATVMEHNIYDISCIIEIGSSKYSFTMNGNGLKELLDEFSDMKYELSQK